MLIPMTVKTKLDSPTSRKVKRKNSSEPTMTFHTRAATDEIYSIFNQPLKAELQAGDAESLYGSDYEDDDYTSAGESTATGRISAVHSEFGDEETTAFDRTQDINADEEFGDQTGVSEWTEYNPAEHIQTIHRESHQHAQGSSCERNNSGSLGEHANTGEEEEDNEENRFFPIEPDDYNPPTGPYRDPYVLAQNRLPFMTPIIEQTESSLASTLFRDREKGHLSTKTPSKMGRCFMPPTTPAIPEVEDLLLSSPFQDYTQANETVLEYTRDINASDSLASFKTLSPKSPIAKRSGHAIITEPQCNPMDNEIQERILRNVRPALSTFPGYYDHKSELGGNIMDIRKYFKLAKGSRTSGGDKSPAVPPVLCFPNAARSYAIKRELGEGGFAPVYLVESVDSPDTFTDSEDDDSDEYALNPRTPSPKKGKFSKPLRNVVRGSLEAIKVESNPPSAWEFYILRIAHARLSANSLHRRATDSIVQAHELHYFKDESVLVEDYRNQGTLIDLLNIVNAECRNGVGASDPGLDEVVAMLFAVELFRTVESLHACGVIHGDLKADNCLVRFDEAGFGVPISLLDSDPDTADYSPSGSYGWRNKGLALIDFGRAIDMHAFVPHVQFIADWKVAEHECSEMKECRPWTYQVDMYGLAGIVYIMLFGKYMEVTTASNTENGNGGRAGFGSHRSYRIKETLKRYWERGIWAEVFDLCLNPTSAKWAEIEVQHSNSSKENVDPNLATNGTGQMLPVLNSMRLVREKMEKWLVTNAGRKGLRGHLIKLETLIAKKRTKRDRG